jgi:cytochrome o ubiquinol oxidase subunit IV
MSIHGVQGSIKTYVVGLIVCVILTLIPYYIVVHHLLSGGYLIAAVVGIGSIQALIQLVLFLHLGDEDRPRWNLMSFLFMALVLVIIVYGSLWIMDNLEGRTMPPMEQMMDHVHRNQGM